MVSWNEGEEGDNWVTYGTAFSDDETEEGRLRQLQFGKRKNLPSAYEQRVLNERGRPLRFHGAFTGGFSAGYFNTVGSKEGFKPRSFVSSRKARQRDAEENVVQRPEDFMDEEDFGEFGIAPRRIKMATAFDDTHVRDSLKTILGGQSIIPDAGSIVKELIIPSRGPLADRLLRKLGWKDTSLILKQELSDTEVEGDSEHRPIDGVRTAPALYTQICFDAKTNTFGLGYSGLDPNVAMGRRPDQGGITRHPEESSTALSQRQSSLPSGFNPLGGTSARTGIRGQAFGVGALEVDDGDIYARDDLGDYDWEIGGEASEDEEEAELEAARAGRWSSIVAKKKGTGKYDGWTAPSLSKGKTAKPNVLHGFVQSSSNSNDPTTMQNQSIRLPPGYMPVFNPLCVRDPEQVDAPAQPKARSLDPQARGRLLEDSGSVFDHLTPVEQLRLEAAAAGLPVPSRTEPPKAQSAIPEPSIVSTPAPTTPALLKPFKTDPHKQARFEAFQVLLRRGFTPEVAYTRCSGAVDMPGDERERELNCFLTILRIDRQPSTKPSTEASLATPVPNFDRPAPLSSHLPPHKQRLVASMLSSRFRSAGCMDISKELSESEEKALRAKVESLETMDPRDHAVATESYGALTRRRLTWHPDRVLCKRINVPHPYPDSTFVGCPDERRPRNPFRRRRFGQRGDKDTGKFSLFDILDVNAGVEAIESDESEEDERNEATSLVSSTVTSEPPAVTDTQPLSTTAIPSLTMPSTPVYHPNPRGAALFACLFDAAEAASETAKTTEIEGESEVIGPKPVESVSTPITGPRILGPALPSASTKSTDEEESRPPMDLFKSIFASDEELSSSDSEEQTTAEPTTSVAEAKELVNPPHTRNLADEASLESLAHLFQPTGASDTPLFALSRLTSQSSTALSRSNANATQPHTGQADFYGPVLPPTGTDFVAEPHSIDQSFKKPHEDDQWQWTDAKDAKAMKKRKRKHSKQKTHKRHKHSSKKSNRRSQSKSTDDESD